NCVDVALIADCAVGDEACQISATPDVPLALLTRLHVRPPPLMVRLWPPAAGPSDVANATTRSPAKVSNVSVVLAPVPSTITAFATASLPPPARRTLIVVVAVAAL